jgi:hypothetical protein
MPRPSQCQECGMFEHCLFPQAQNCPERIDRVNREAEKDND